MSHGFSVARVVRLLFAFMAVSSAVGQSGSGSRSDDPYMAGRITPSMAIIIIVLITAIFFMGFFAIYIRHCTDGGGGSVRAMVAAVAGRSRRGRGLDSDALQAMPVFAYSEVKGLKMGKGGALECAVCLNEFEDSETLRLIPKCDHVFHADCIDVWLASHTTCPVCRANLDDTVEPVRAEISPVEPDAPPSITTDEIVVQDQGDAPATSAQPATPSPPPRPPRSWSAKRRFFTKLPRSYSTGHSVVQPGEDCERFTLRLPVDVRKQLVSRGLERATSMICRTGGEGRNYRRLDRVKSDRWVFAVPRSTFFSRVPSVKTQRVPADGDPTGSSPAVPKLLTAVKGPLSCLSPKTDCGLDREPSDSLRLSV